ncbi:MAG: ADOP family duplicated permease [Acidobacteriota bacterium]|jgi:predicted permease
MSRSHLVVTAAFRRLHALCLLLLPRAFRAINGDALRDTFEDAVEESARRGVRSLLATAAAECVDVARQSWSLRHAHADRPPRTTLLDGLALDARVAARSLGRRHSLLVIVALALGIGATTAVFGVVDAVLLRDLPYRDAARLVRVGALRAGSSSLGSLSPPVLAALQQRAGTLEITAASSGSWVTLTGEGRPQRIRAGWVSGEFFTLLGGDAARGRLLDSADDDIAAAPVALLSHPFFERAFAGDTGVIGHAIILDGSTYTVVGVLGDDFVPPEGNGLSGAFDLWLPLAHLDLMGEPGIAFLDAFARRASDATMTATVDEMDALGRTLANELGLPERAFMTLRAAPLREHTVGAIGATLWTLMGAVSLLLLIACANVANLMLTRAAARGHEVGLRVALGAGSGRIARLLLLESTLLALVGGVAGAAVAALAVAALRAFQPAGIPRLSEITVDARVLLFTLLTATAVGAASGLAPVLRARRADPASALATGTRGASAGRDRTTLARALVITQTALALMLVIAACLLANSFVRLARVDVGFDTADLMRMQVNFGNVLDGSDEIQQQRVAFFSELRRHVAGLPGVNGAWLTTGAPFSPGGWFSSINVIGRGEGEPGGPGSEEPAYRHQVSGDYLDALGLRLLAGRGIGDTDRAGTLPVVVVNESLARLYWPYGDALGAQVTIGGDGTFTPRTVVGIVSDARYHELEDEPGLHVYLPFEQFPAFAMDVMARFDGEPATVAAAMREAVWSLRDDLAVRDVSSMRELVYADLIEPGFYTWLLGSFGAVALLLAGVGIYASMAHATGARTREIGIRVAVGARPGETVRLVLRGALMTTVVGMGLGLAGAWATTRYLSGLLYQVEATNGPTWAAASLLFLMLALLAAWLPARRAAHVDPVVALRSQ